MASPVDTTPSPATHFRHRHAVLGMLDSKWAGDPEDMNDPQALMRKRIAETLAECMP
jgi:hypothetical protein